jgi:hypothetical protein
MGPKGFFDKVLDVVRVPARKLNETWDGMESIWQVGLWSAFLIIGIVFIPRFFLFIGIVIVAAQRIGYHSGIFKDEKNETSVPNSTDSTKI